MPAAHNLLLFVLAGLALNFTPGPDMLLVASTSAGSGARAGVAAALGIGTGCRHRRYPSWHHFCASAAPHCGARATL